MWISELQLANFRSYEGLFLRPESGLCVLTGENAAGKTNILESIFLCALGRSHRTPHDGEMLREGQPFGSVDLTVNTRGGTREIGCRLISGERKRMTVDGSPLSRSADLMGCLNTVLFAPEDLALVKGGPGERRRFLDMEISQLRPRYYVALQQYNAALKQRNALLKDAYAERGDFAVWDEQLSRLGAAITTERAAFAEDLGRRAAEVHHRLSGGRELLSAQYKPNLPEYGDEGHLAEIMYERLTEGLEKDQYRGNTGTGPHRDELELTLDGTDVRIYGSQGQKRTVVLSLKLSELEIMKELRGEPPVLLLDDVFSELDKRRQRLLMEAVSGCQCFITCTHLEELADAGAAELQMQVFAVGMGTATEV